MSHELMLPGQPGFFLPDTSAPNAQRDVIMNLPKEERDKMKPFFASMVAHWEPIDRHFPELLTQFAPELQPDATVAVLASGVGGELLQIRKHLPKSRIVAFDVEVVEQTVATEVLSDAEFHQKDISASTPEEIVGVVGATPDLVLCRHPFVFGDPWWPRVLAEWGKFVTQTESTLLITNYEPLEQVKIVEALQLGGISLEASTYYGAMRLEGAHNPDLRADKYVTVVRGIPQE